MWEFLSGIWGGISSTVGSAYDTVSTFVEDTYDDYFTDYSKDSMSNYFTPDRGSSTSSVLGTAMEFAGGFMDVVAPAGGSPTQMPSSKKRRVSAPNSTASAGQFSVSKSNLANLDHGYTPRVNAAIQKINVSNVPSLKEVVAQMVNYKSSGGTTIKIKGSSMPSVTARTKQPSFAPKYYG